MSILIESLPYAEQQAMRLDGEAYRLGDLHVPIDVPEAAEVRAAACGARSSRLIAALRTAAWIWGAEPVRPAVDEFMVDTEARYRPRAGERVAVIEAVFHEGDVRRFGDAAVTAPMRTALDLCRFSPAFDDDLARVVRELAAIGGFGLEDCLRELAARPRLAGARRTRERLAGSLADGIGGESSGWTGAQPLLTR